MIRSAGAGSSSSGSDTKPVVLTAIAGTRSTLVARLGLLGSDRAHTRTVGSNSRKALAAISKVSRRKLNVVGAAKGDAESWQLDSRRFKATIFASALASPKSPV